MSIEQLLWNAKIAEQSMKIHNLNGIRLNAGLPPMPSHVPSSVPSHVPSSVPSLLGQYGLYTPPMPFNRGSFFAIQVPNPSAQSNPFNIPLQIPGAQHQQHQQHQLHQQHQQHQLHQPNPHQPSINWIARNGLPPAIPRAANGAFLPVSDDGRSVYLTLHLPGRFSTVPQWGTFGGRCRRGERSINAALREALEEGFSSNVPVDPRSLVGTSCVHGDGSHTTVYVGIAPPGTHWVAPTQNIETIAGQWFTKTEVANLHQQGLLRFGRHITNITNLVLL